MKLLRRWGWLLEIWSGLIPIQKRRKAPVEWRQKQCNWSLTPLLLFKNLMHWSFHYIWYSLLVSKKKKKNWYSLLRAGQEMFLLVIRFYDTCYRRGRNRNYSCLYKRVPNWHDCFSCQFMCIIFTFRNLRFKTHC